MARKATKLMPIDQAESCDVLEFVSGNRKGERALLERWESDYQIWVLTGEDCELVDASDLMLYKKEA